MKLYEINSALMALLEQVDPETGELTCDIEQLEALTLAREEKLEGLALAYKNYAAEAAAIRAEEKNLADRRKALENRGERTRAFLEAELMGEPLKTARVAVSYRKTTAVQLGPDFMSWARENDRFLRWKDPEPDKVALAAALKAGEDLGDKATLVTSSSMQIR